MTVVPPLTLAAIHLIDEISVRLVPAAMPLTLTIIIDVILV
jgi:hypothetical protein